ncbi:MAG: preprotein translocase subunit SecE [Opitutaceae bacterium]|nr:preprotein translocase subunit SecE [Opitutaceae bacterium]
MKNPFRSTRIFFGEMVGELQKAAWPTRSELRDSTIVVLVAAVILGVFTSISDFPSFPSWISSRVWSAKRARLCPIKRQRPRGPSGSPCTPSPARRTR